MQLDMHCGDRVDMLGGDVRGLCMRRGRVSCGVLGLGLRTLQGGHVWGQLLAVRMQRERALPGRERGVRVLCGLRGSRVLDAGPAAEVRGRVEVHIGAVR